MKKRRKKKGTLIVIGGHEDKTNHGKIISAIAEIIKGGKLVVLPFGSNEPEEMVKMYKPAFRAAGIKHLYFLNLQSRDEAKQPGKIKILKDAAGVFFTGGDQHKINSIIAYTPFCDMIYDLYEHGGLVAGTSAGASVLSQTMLVYPDHKSTEDFDHNEFDMAPGLGLLPPYVIIDQHFSQRSRFGRLLSAVGRNPSLLGIGLDENTAIMIEKGKTFKTIGEGLVYVFDGSDISYMDLKDTAFNMRVHIMDQGHEFDLINKQPVIPSEPVKADLTEHERIETKLKEAQ